MFSRPALPSRQTVAQSAVEVPLTGTTDETTLAAVTLPPLGPNDRVEVASVWTYTNSANNKIMRMKLGSTAYMVFTATTTARLTDLRGITNRGATNSQVGDFGSTVSSAGGTSSAGLVKSSIDTSGGSSISLTAQLANSGETVTLESYRVEVVRAP